MARRSVVAVGREASAAAVRPFLKWVGGKRQLLPHLRRFYPAEFNRYIEPFLGSGAVFFDLHSRARLRDRDVLLVDSNADLIGCYEAVRDAPGAMADALDRLAEGHALDGRAHYYDVRDGRFNPMRKGLRRPDGSIAYTPELAAMLVYLNRTGFNGLFRLNATGEFNVPAGRYERPRISDRAALFAVSAVLAAPRVRLAYTSFESVLDFASEGDFLYVDPPYAPLSSTANFTSYTFPRFGRDDQRRLQQVVVTLARRGCHVLLSNSTAEDIVGLYETNIETRAAGLRTLRVPARRAINSNAARRGPVDEYLITNCQRADA
jgi:DNA adenine methylase